MNDEICQSLLHPINVSNVLRASDNPCLRLGEDGADGGDAVGPGHAPEVRAPGEALWALAPGSVLDDAAEGVGAARRPQAAGVAAHAVHARRVHRALGVGRAAGSAWLAGCVILNITTMVFYHTLFRAVFPLLQTCLTQ